MGVKTPAIDQRWQMRFKDEMHIEARLAYVLMKNEKESLPEGTSVQVVGISEGTHRTVHVRQVNNGNVYGLPYSYPEELFVGWYKRVR